MNRALDAFFTSIFTGSKTKIVKTLTKLIKRFESQDNPESKSGLNEAIATAEKEIKNYYTDEDTAQELLLCISDTIIYMAEQAEKVNNDKKLKSRFNSVTWVELDTTEAKELGLDPSDPLSPEETRNTPQDPVCEISKNTPADGSLFGAIHSNDLLMVNDILNSDKSKINETFNIQPENTGESEPLEPRRYTPITYAERYNRKSIVEFLKTVN
jgi:hypothetical protein